MRTLTGIERLASKPGKWLLGKRLGLLANPASVDRRLRHTAYILNDIFPGRLTTLLSPQHGFFAEKQDNMITSGDTEDPVLGIPVYSLYGQTRWPTEEMLADIDTLIIDLQDVGTRVYTFIYTMAYCLEAAARHDLRVVILDRPNPVNGVDLEGNLLVPEYASFVGRYPIPMRHGLTIGELGLLFNDWFNINCRLDVISMRNWERSMFFADTGLPWVAPSPNLPTPVSALVYPGQVIWEGTNISEGRGTTQPFELFGAPFIDPHRTAAAEDLAVIPGAVLRPAVFEPTWNKWRGQPCRGFQIHLLNPDEYRPWSTSLRLLQTIRRLYPADFAWRQPPYEYEYEKLPIDLILGDASVRKKLEAGESIGSLEESWEDDLARFKTNCRPFRLYP